MMGILEGMVSEVVKEIHGGYTLEYQGQTLDFTPPWPRVDWRTALKERDSHYLKVRAAYNPAIRVTRFAGCGGKSVDIERRGGTRSAEWQIVYRRSVFHARYCLDAIDHLLIQNRTLSRTRILRVRNGDANSEDVRRVEARIDPLELPETLDEQAGTGQ